jgi:hypothetical protein
MPSWYDALDLQRRSRRNALYAAAALHRRHAEADEAASAAAAAARRSFIDGARHEPPHRAVSPEQPVELR